jgi:hypothetical protein
MLEAWTDVITNFRSFIGTGWLLWVAFCVSLAAVFFLHRENRGRFVTVSLILCAVVFNPIVYSLIGERFLSGVYWRLFWTLPIVITIAYALTELCARIRIGILRVVAVGAMCALIAVTGERVINRGTYTVPENDYQIPQAAIDIADVIYRDTGGVRTKIVAPDDLVCYIRQYNMSICLGYGRDMWGFITTPDEQETEIYETIHSEEIDFLLLRQQSYWYDCRYIVFDTEVIDLPEDMESYGYDLLDNVGKYRIYSLQQI